MWIRIIQFPNRKSPKSPVRGAESETRPHCSKSTFAMAVLRVAPHTATGQYPGAGGRQRWSYAKAGEEERDGDGERGRSCGWQCVQSCCRPRESLRGFEFVLFVYGLCSRWCAWGGVRMCVLLSVETNIKREEKMHVHTCMCVRARRELLFARKKHSYASRIRNDTIAIQCRILNVLRVVCIIFKYLIQILINKNMICTFIF